MSLHLPTITATATGGFDRIQAMLFAQDRERQGDAATDFLRAFVPPRQGRPAPRLADRYVLPLELPALPQSGIL